MTKRIPLVVLLFAVTLSAQPATRRATNLAALTSHATFFHLRPIVVVGEVTHQDNGETRVTSDGTSLLIVSKGPTPEGLDEIRGEFWDVGRMKPDDPQLAGYDIRATFKFDPSGTWPRPGEVTAIIASAVSPAVPPPAPTVRNIVLNPSRYLDQPVTVTGQFGGRNLLGDLPDAPARSRYDFVLRSADAAVWVTNIRPRGKDFELALDARIDTGRWLEVTGTLQQGRGLQWLDATSGSLKLTRPPKDPGEDTQIRVPLGAPPEVIFSTPTSEETEVQLSSSIRVQFSRDMDPATFKGRVVVKYSAASASPADEPPLSIPALTTQYLPGTRVLELRFASPFERFRTVTVDLQEGILGTDKQALKPWRLAFQTGP